VADSGLSEAGGCDLSLENSTKPNSRVKFQF